MLKFFVPRACALEALFGGGPLLARGAHRFERLARGAIGLGEGGFGLCERVGGGLAGRFRPPMFVRQRSARAGEIGRRVVERAPFALRFRTPLRELGDAVLRMGEPLVPGRPLGGDCAEPRGPRRSLASDGLRRRPRFGKGGPLVRRQLARALKRLHDFVAWPELIKRGLRAGLAFSGLIARRAGARKGLFHCRQTRQGLSARALKLRQGVAGGVRRRPGGADPPTPFRFRRGGFTGVIGHARRFGAQRRCRLARSLGFALEVAEPVLFDQTTSGRARRFGGGDEAVPAPEVAFEGDQPLTWLELLGEPLALRAGHNTDLSQTPGQRRRRGDTAGKRIGSGRQRGIRGRRRNQRPVRRRRLVHRGLEIVAQRRAKRRLVAARDADRVDRPGPGPARVGAEKARDRARFRLQPLRSAFGVSQRPTTQRLGLAGRGVAFFRRQSFALGGSERFGCHGGGMSPRCALGLLKTRCVERAALALDSGAFRFEAREAPSLLFERRDQRTTTRGEVRRRSLSFGKRAFGASEATFSALLRFPGLNRVLVRPAPCSPSAASSAPSRAMTPAASAIRASSR